MPVGWDPNVMCCVALRCAVRLSCVAGEIDGVAERLADKKEGRIGES